MHQPGVGVGTDVRLGPEIVLLTLARLVHLGVAGLGFVLGRGRRGNDGGVHQGTLLQQQPTATQQVLDGLEDAPGEIVGLQQPTEPQQRGGVGHRLPAEVDSQEGPKCLAVVEGVLQRLVGEPEPLLQEVHPQHPLQPNRGTASTRARLGVVVGCQNLKQHRPGHHPIHLAQEAVAARGLALGVVLGLGEGDLLGHGEKGKRGQAQ